MFFHLFYFRLTSADTFIKGAQDFNCALPAKSVREFLSPSSTENLFAVHKISHSKFRSADKLNQRRLGQ